MSAGIFALFFFGEVPRVRRDILQQFPFFDTYYDRRLAPEDNVSFSLSFSFSFLVPVDRNMLDANLYIKAFLIWLLLLGFALWSHIS